MPPFCSCQRVVHVRIMKLRTMTGEERREAQGKASAGAYKLRRDTVRRRTNPNAFTSFCSLNSLEMPIVSKKPQK